jgi:hypothetical protein
MSAVCYDVEEQNMGPVLIAGKAEEWAHGDPLYKSLYFLYVIKFPCIYNWQLAITDMDKK